MTEEPRPLNSNEIIATKQLRQSLDVELQRMQTLPESVEKNQAAHRLTEAIMWLGMNLKRIGTPNPYPHSKDPGNTIVDPTADGLKMPVGAHEQTR